VTAARWYERYAWIVFAIIGIMGLVIALPVLINPAAGAGVFAQLDGMTLPAAISADPAARTYAEFVYRFAFGATFGLDLMTVLIAVFAFRRGARWAWIAFCYWPALFFTNLLTYEASARPVQLTMLAITIAALAATYRTTWRKTHEADPMLDSAA
jgi:hypothetical protein